MAITIRRADEADAEALSLLNADVQNAHAAAMPTVFKKSQQLNTFPAAVARTLLANPTNIVLIADIDSEPVGYAYAEIVHSPESPSRYPSDEVHLYHISVSPTHRRRGIASALLDAVHRAANELEIKLVTLQVWSFNEDAQTFFRKRGFKPYIIRLWSRQKE